MRRFLFVLILLAWSPYAGAVPLRYQFDVTTGFSAGHPLDGAQIRVEMTWDPTLLAPVPAVTPTYSELRWPNTNTKGTIAISGTAAYDGIFSVEFEGPWQFIDLHELERHRLITPFTTLTLGDDYIEMSRLFADFDNVGSFGPKPFTRTEPIQTPLPLIWMRGYGSYVSTRSVSGYAVALPEPSTLPICCSAMVGLVALCRRKQLHRAAP